MGLCGSWGMSEMTPKNDKFIDLRLSEIVDLHHGYQFRDEDFVSDGIPVIKIGNVKGSGLDLTSVTCVDESRLEEFSDVVIKNGDILMSLTGNVGRVVVVDGLNHPVFQNYRVGKFEPLTSEIDRGFLACLLSSETLFDQLEQYSNQSAQANFGKQDLNKLKVTVPSNIDKQKKIAKILTTIDNLIEQTQALIDKYTAIKQGMMADLFTRGIDLSGTRETNPNHGQLRPSFEEAPELYKETELGWVPKGWVVVSLEDVATVGRGKFTHRPRDDAKCYGGIYPFIQTGSVTKANGGFISTYSQTLSEYGRNVSKEFPAGTVAVTIAANIADTAILPIPMCFPDSIVGVVVNEQKAKIRFVEVIIRLNKPTLDALAPLSAQKNINLEDLRPLKIPLPALSEQANICEKYDAIERYISNNFQSMKKLQLQKKGLMQDLLTGKVQVTA